MVVVRFVCVIRGRESDTIRGGTNVTKKSHEPNAWQPQNNPHLIPTHRLTRQTRDHTCTPERTRRHKPHHSPDQARWCGDGGGDGAQTTRRGSSEGASLTASVTALLRVPGGAEVSGFGIRERLIALMVHARRQGPVISTVKRHRGEPGRTHTGHKQASLHYDSQSYWFERMA